MHATPAAEAPRPSRLAGPGERDRAAARIRQAIHDGALAPGRQLPSERQLAEELGIGRTVVRNLLAALERERLIRREGRRAWYVTGSAAAALPPLISRTVAVVVDAGSVRSAGTGALGEPGWGHHLFRGAADAILAAGHHCLTLTERSLDNDTVAALVAAPPRGVLVITDRPGLASRAQVLRALHVHDIPVAAYGDVHDWPGCDVVLSDHELGQSLVTRALLERGCRRILPCWVPLNPPPGWALRREAGYRRACREAGIRPCPPFIVPDTPGDFAARAAQLARQLTPHLCGAHGADALMAVSDGMLFLLAAAARILGRKPGRDLLLAGYDNYWREAPDRVHGPVQPFATVDKDNGRIGRELAGLVLARAAGGLAPGPQRRVVPPRLILEEPDGAAGAAGAGVRAPQCAFERVCTAGCESLPGTLCTPYGTVTALSQDKVESNREGTSGP